MIAHINLLYLNWWTGFVTLKGKHSRPLWWCEEICLVFHAVQSCQQFSRMLHHFFHPSCIIPSCREKWEKPIQTASQHTIFNFECSMKFQSRVFLITEYLHIPTSENCYSGGEWIWLWGAEGSHSVGFNRSCRNAAILMQNCFSLVLPSASSASCFSLPLDESLSVIICQETPMMEIIKTSLKTKMAFLER